MFMKLVSETRNIGTKCYGKNGKHGQINVCLELLDREKKKKNNPKKTNRFHNTLLALSHCECYFIILGESLYQLDLEQCLKWLLAPADNEHVFYYTIW